MTAKLPEKENFNESASPAPKTEQYRGKKREMEFCNEAIIEETAEYLGLSPALIRDVVINGQSKFTATAIRTNNFEGVRWPYLGVFKVKPKAVMLMKYIKGLDKNFRRIFMEKVRRTGFIYGDKTKSNNNENSIGHDREDD